MAKPSAFVIMPYRDPFEVLYKDILEIILIENGFVVVRADKIPASRPFADDIHKSIVSSDLIIADVSITNPNVYYELGIAQALKKELIILTHDADTLQSDTRHIRHLIYELDDKDKFKKDFQEWVQRTRAYQLKSRKESPKVLNRGDIFTYITDATFYLEYNRGSDDKAEIINCIRNGALIPPKYLYKFDRGCYLWLDLCKDTEYHYHASSVTSLGKNIDKIIENIGDDIVSNAPDYISLGPGNGKKDQIILRKLIEKQKIRNADMYYYPFDISPTMISSAIHTVTYTKAISDSLKIKAIVADFGKTLKSFAPVYQYRPETNIFSLLGNTLGNIENETSFLDKIRQAMFTGDILMVEVRLLSEKPADIGGSLALNKSFDFTPLDILGIEYDEEKLKYSTLSTRSQIPNTRTIVATYNKFRMPSDENIVDSAYLSYVHEYDHEALRSVIEDLKFEILNTFINTTDSIAFYVLRKPSD